MENKKKKILSTVTHEGERGNNAANLKSKNKAQSDPVVSELLVPFIP